jgi:hypothetical protein
MIERMHFGSDEAVQYRKSDLERSVYHIWHHFRSCGIMT